MNNPLFEKPKELTLFWSGVMLLSLLLGACLWTGSIARFIIGGLASLTLVFMGYNQGVTDGTVATFQGIVERAKHAKDAMDLMDKILKEKGDAPGE